ncbi:AgmX/PglI C-terminal domain-containing protein [Pseudobdellovibrio sp. HCB154]|uniref:AgmX/PglI C-terminal domain-containing protein n=1 Tax=Pseudobdellovibrio sp. HCB154 TaxID=3386277 RepID=UPI0039170C7E
MKNKFLISLAITFVSLFSFAKSQNTESFQKPIKKNLAKLQSCSEKSATAVSGTVVVDLEINDNASIQRIKINDEQSTLTDLNVQQCVVLTMKTFKFPKAAKGQIVPFSYPVNFK